MIIIILKYDRFDRSEHMVHNHDVQNIFPIFIACWLKHLFLYKVKWLAVKLSSLGSLAFGVIILLATYISYQKCFIFLLHLYCNYWSKFQSDYLRYSFVVFDSNFEYEDQIRQNIENQASRDLGFAVHSYRYKSENETLEKLYELQRDHKNSNNIGFLYSINDDSIINITTSPDSIPPNKIDGVINFHLFVNNTEYMTIARAIANTFWKLLWNDPDATIETNITVRNSDSGEASAVLRMLAVGLFPLVFMSAVMFSVSETVDEIHSARMDYLRSCRINLLSFWSSRLIIDFIY
jgi:hypothetical protein